MDIVGILKTFLKFKFFSCEKWWCKNLFVLGKNWPKFSLTFPNLTHICFTCRFFHESSPVNKHLVDSFCLISLFLIYSYIKLMYELCTALNTKWLMYDLELLKILLNGFEKYFLLILSLSQILHLGKCRDLFFLSFYDGVKLFKALSCNGICMSF